MTYRRTQLEVISKRPDRALLKGPRQTGKRLCLEVGQYVLEYWLIDGKVVKSLDRLSKLVVYHADILYSNQINFYVDAICHF